MSNKPTSIPYDAVDHGRALQPRQHATIGYGTLSMVGTLTGTAVATDVFIVPANSAITVTGAYAKKGVGGTFSAAAPAWNLAKVTPIAGIGTAAPSHFGTLVWGTHADGSYQDFSVTSTKCAAGDIIRLLTLPGTSSNPTTTITGLTLEYKEDWS